MSFLLGIDEGDGFVFEGTSTVGGHLLFPAPVITEAKFAHALDHERQITPAAYGTRYIFREDIFDPVSRIRRGRFYKSNGSTQSWSVQRHPTVNIPFIGQNAAYISTRAIQTCSSFFFSGEFPGNTVADLVVILGNPRASTIWSVIHIEGCFSGEEIVTLKARQSFGNLPRMNWDKVPENAQANIQEKLNLLEDDYLRAGAASVVDHAREAATAILSAYLQQEGVAKAKGKDLGDLINLLTEKYGKTGKRIVACAAEIPQRLHSRRKSSEQEKHELPPIREQDAQLAVQCIGTILCDLKWGEWR